MRKVILTMNENVKYETIKKVSDGLMSKTKAEVVLGLSRRQINRLLASYRQFGKEAFRHKNRGRPSQRATDPETKEKVVNLYLNDKYHASNISHFTLKNSCGSRTVENIELEKKEKNIEKGIKTTE